MNYLFKILHKYNVDIWGKWVSKSQLMKISVLDYQANDGISYYATTFFGRIRVSNHKNSEKGKLLNWIDIVDSSLNWNRIEDKLIKEIKERIEECMKIKKTILKSTSENITKLDIRLKFLNDHKAKIENEIDWKNILAKGNIDNLIDIEKTKIEIKEKQKRLDELKEIRSFVKSKTKWIDKFFMDRKDKNAS